MPIQVNMADHTGNRTRQAKLAENAPISKLIPHIVTALGYPVTDPAGRQVTYHLSYNGQQLQDDETLASAGVRNGESISIVPDMTAGATGRTFEFAGRSEPPPPLVELGSEKRLYHPRRGFPAFAGGSGREVGVCLAAEVLERIEAHARAQAEIEVGGILYGQVYEDAGRFLVMIEGSEPARHVIASCAMLQFTCQSWLEILQRLPARSGSAMLGWYHSHPGLGIFFSETDRFTHSSFFSKEPWYVGLVVDPCSGDYGAFTWEKRKISRSPEVLIV